MYPVKLRKNQAPSTLELGNSPWELEFPRSSLQLVVEQHGQCSDLGESHYVDSPRQREAKKKGGNGNERNKAKNAERCRTQRSNNCISNYVSWWKFLSGKKETLRSFFSFFLFGRISKKKRKAAPVEQKVAEGNEAS